MKNVCIVLLLLVGNSTVAQERLAKFQAPSCLYVKNHFDSKINMPSAEALKLPTNVKLYSVASADGVFHKTYWLNTDGETVSTGFMPFSYFRPNNNLFVVAGPPDNIRDSLNPYGGIDVESMLIVEVLNRLVRRLEVKRR